MARSWDNVKAADRSQFPHPLLSFGAELAQIIAKNKADLEAKGKGMTISLAVGDPALDGNMPPPKVLLDKMEESISSTRSNGYTPCVGTVEVREAIAQYWVHWFAPSLEGKVGSGDVVLASGCSDALTMVFGAIANAGECILIPKPYFAQYDMTAAYFGIQPVYYPCDPSKNWEIDLVALRKIIEADAAGEKKIRGCLLNNPSNPCGSNWSRQHVTDIVKLLDELRIPIISDEIYAGMVFDINDADAKVEFTSVADVDSMATRFVLCGASKRFSIPGERLGWVLLVDPSGAGKDIMGGVRHLAARYLIPSSVLQAALVTSLKATDQAYYQRNIEVVRANAAYVYDALRKIPAFKPLVPSGGMFMSVLLEMDKFDKSISSGIEFAYKLAEEENVLVFPGEPFQMPNAIRLTLSRPSEIAVESVKRLAEFCERHKA